MVRLSGTYLSTNQTDKGHLAQVDMRVKERERGKCGEEHTDTIGAGNAAGPTAGLTTTERKN